MQREIYVSLVHFMHDSLLLDQALIMEGKALPEPGAFARRLSRLVAQGLAPADD